MDNNKAPKISILMPCYNAENYIEQCLSSIIEQTFDGFEVICVNDGSSDRTLEILNDFSNKDSRIKVTSQENQGPAIAYNNCIKLASGEYITFIDNDDWVNKDYLSNLYKALIENDCDISVSTMIRKRKHHEKYRIHCITKQVYETLQEKIDACCVPKCCYVMGKLYKAELVKSNYFKDNIDYEDMFWLPETIKAAKKIVTVPNSIYYYRANPKSIVKSVQTLKKQKDLYNAKKYIINFFDENNLTLSKNYRNVTKNIKYFLNVPIIKTKEYNDTETISLLGFLPIYSKRDSVTRCVYNICGLKLTIRKNKLSDKEYKRLNAPYEKGEITNVPKVKDRYETLNELISTNKSIARYGDGEFNLLFGEDLPFQNNSPKLKEKLKEILVSDDENVMIGISGVFANLDQYNDYALKFWRRYLVTNREHVYKQLRFEKQYYDTMVSRCYIDLEDRSHVLEYFNNFKKVWENKDVIFVEGSATRLGYNNDLFSNVSSVKRIVCPAKNSFAKYEEILEKCKKQDKDKLFIIALGPTATVLAYDLSKLGYRALDLGHIDIEYEWFLQGADKRVPIKNKYVNEVQKGRKIESISDDKYNSEIIFDCSKESANE